MGSNPSRGTTFPLGKVKRAAKHLVSGKAILYVVLYVVFPTVTIAQVRGFKSPKITHMQNIVTNIAPNTTETATPTTLRPAPGRSTSANPIWVAEADGIWRNTKAKQKWLYERPIIRGKETFKALGTKRLKLAKEEFARRITLRAQGTEPTEKASKATTAGAVIRLYIDADYPDKMLNPRPELMKGMEAKNSQMLLGFWDPVPVEACTCKRFDEYKDWRVKKLERSTAGTRMIDLELNTLTNAFRLAKRRELVLFNPMIDHQKFHDPKNVAHCREYMPQDSTELHERASILFRHPRSAVLGFQYLFEAMTGLRTEEVLYLGTEKDGTRFGTLTECGKFMRVWRCKGQRSVNPYCAVHDGLNAVMKAHKAWKAAHYPDSPLFFPSPVDPSQPVGSEALAHALGHLPGKKVTSHGARAFYVTVRRSWGIPDSQIAFEIGHTSGGSTLAKVYGGVPLSWLTNGPRMSWLPKGRPAWKAHSRKKTKSSTK